MTDHLRTLSTRCAAQAEIEPFTPDAAFFHNPYPTYRRYRENDPVHWSPPLRAWFVFRHDEVHACLRNHEALSSATYDRAMLERLSGGTVGPFGRDALTKLNRIDPPAHTRIRSLAEKAFTPSAAQRLTPCITANARNLLIAALPGGRMDVMRSFASQLPLLTLCDLLGLPASDASRVKSLSDASALDPTRMDQITSADAAVTDLEAYFRSQLSRTGANGLLSRLATVEDAGDTLTEDELFSLLRLLLNGGHRSTANAIGNCVCTLLARPERVAALRACIGDPDSMDAAVNELLRYDTSVQMAVRRARTDLEVGGKRIRTGDTVNLVLGSANRDPYAFDDPDRVDMRRAQTRNAVFGFGVHECMGAFLARIEVRVALEALFAGVTGHTLDDDGVQYHQMLKFRGPVSLSLTFAAQPV